MCSVGDRRRGSMGPNRGFSAIDALVATLPLRAMSARLLLSVITPTVSHLEPALAYVMGMRDARQPRATSRRNSVGYGVGTMSLLPARTSSQEGVT
jgi:hypothetical protein